MKVQLPSSVSSLMSSTDSRDSNHVFSNAPRLKTPGRRCGRNIGLVTTLVYPSLQFSLPRGLIRTYVYCFMCWIKSNNPETWCFVSFFMIPPLIPGIRRSRPSDTAHHRASFPLKSSSRERSISLKSKLGQTRVAATCISFWCSNGAGYGRRI